MVAHEEGPWRIRVDKDTDGTYLVVLDKRGNTIGFANTDANARLIAAAPEMLEALEGLLLYVTDVDVNHIPPLSAAINAIAKAKGE